MRCHYSLTKLECFVKYGTGITQNSNQANSKTYVKHGDNVVYVSGLQVLRGETLLEETTKWWEMIRLSEDGTTMK